MARIRTIKPDAFTSDSLSRVSYLARWTFAGLWTHVDDEGRCRSDVRLIKAALFPLDDRTTLKDVTSALAELEAEDCICFYEVSGKGYLHCINFKCHQRVNRPTPSNIPECPKTTHGALSESSVSPQRGNGSGSGSGSVEDSPADATEGDERPEVTDLCNLLADLIRSNGGKATVSKKWEDAARLMLDRDERSESEAKRLIQWSQQDEFWRSNILSMPKFREKYDQLRLQADRRKPQQDVASDSLWGRLRGETA